MNKIWILLFIGILTISLIGCNINSNLKNTNFNDETKNQNNMELIDKKVSLEDANDIDIEISAAKVSVNIYDGDEVELTGKLSEKSNGIDINKNGKKISIVEKENKSITTFLDFSIDDGSQFDILVPSKFNGNFSFKHEVGSSNIEGIKVENIDITGGAGELICENIKFDKLNLTSSVGKVNLNLKDKCGDILINGGVGETDIKIEEVGGNLRYKGDVGSSNITIPKNSPVKFITQKGVGKCEVDAKTSGEETYTFDLKSGVGSINVHN